MLNDTAVVVGAAFFVPDTPPTQGNPIYLNSADGFTAPKAFVPNVVVDIDSVAEKKFQCVSAMPSQFGDADSWQGRTLPNMPADDDGRVVEQDADIAVVRVVVVRPVADDDVGLPVANLARERATRFEVHLELAIVDVEHVRGDPENPRALLDFLVPADGERPTRLAEVTDVAIGRRDELHLVALRRPQRRNAGGLQLGVIGMRAKDDDAQLARRGGLHCGDRCSAKGKDEERDRRKQSGHRELKKKALSLKWRSIRPASDRTACWPSKADDRRVQEARRATVD